MSDFDSLEELNSETIDLIIAEPFRPTPMAHQGDVNGRRRPDGDRPVIEAEGVLNLQPAQLAGISTDPGAVGREANDFNTVRNGFKAALTVQVRHFDGKLPRPGDQIEILEGDQQTFDVVRVEPESKSRVNLVLAERT